MPKQRKSLKCNHINVINVNFVTITEAWKYGFDQTVCKHAFVISKRVCISLLLKKIEATASKMMPV